MADRIVSTVRLMAKTSEERSYRVKGMRVLCYADEQVAFDTFPELPTSCKAQDGMTMYSVKEDMLSEDLRAISARSHASGLTTATVRETTDASKAAKAAKAAARKAEAAVRSELSPA